VVDDKGQLAGEAKVHPIARAATLFRIWCINRKADGGLELPAKVVQERLGHATIAMTMDVYGHLFPRGEDGAELANAAAHLFAVT
jgi:integrase